MAPSATLLPTRSLSLLLLARGAATLPFVASPLQAQVVEFRPIANVSLPTRISLQDGTIHVRQKVGVQFGARMTLTFNDRFDVTNTVTYSPGYATLHGAGKKIELTSGSHSLAGSTSARYWIRRAAYGHPLSWEVHTGVGMVFGGQPSYLDLFESSTLSAVLGTVVGYQVGRLVNLTLRVQERLLRLRFGDQNAGSSRMPLQFAFGVGFPLLERLR
jgi:hypothetical protein